MVWVTGAHKRHWEQRGLRVGSAARRGAWEARVLQGAASPGGDSEARSWVGVLVGGECGCLPHQPRLF